MNMKENDYITLYLFIHFYITNINQYMKIASSPRTHRHHLVLDATHIPILDIWAHLATLLFSSISPPMTTALGAMR